MKSESIFDLLNDITDLNIVCLTNIEQKSDNVSVAF